MTLTIRLRLARCLAVLTLGLPVLTAHGTPPTIVPAIVPLPQSMQLLEEKPFLLNPGTTLRYAGTGSLPVAQLLAESLRPATGLALPVAPDQGARENTLLLRIDPTQKNHGPEGYRLEVKSAGIVLTASDPRGLFNGTRTLIQLLPPAVHSSKVSLPSQTSIPAVAIQDQPAFPWRGIMLDPARYFMSKEYILRYIDMMALHKLNVLHLHLVDDCGWRVEIKKYPRLTTVGAWRGQGDNRHGGFYSQQDIREMVAYAAARNIEIVPEIEMPAHTLAALVAYPELGCFNKTFTMPTKHSISPELYCVGKESTWKFLEDVFDEIAELFPSKYIHIGGDEANYVRWKKCPDCQQRIKDKQLNNERELQGWATNRLDKYLSAKGKKLLGWEEILYSGASKNSAIMTWHQARSAVDGAKNGNQVVMSYVHNTYFDTPESKLPGEPPAATWTPPVTLRMAYQWHPVPDGLTPAEAKNILGPNGCVWNDRFLHNADVLADKPGQGSTASEAYVDYLSLPRLAALAEVGWTTRDKRDFTDFSNRMSTLLARYEVLGYKYRIPVPEISIKRNPGSSSYTLTASPAINGGSIRYTLDGTSPTRQSREMKSAIEVTDISRFRAANFSPDGSRHSLLFQHVDESNKYAAHGTLIGQWKSGQIGNKKAKEVVFDATGHIDGNGEYIITFLYTGGRERLDIDGIEVVRNDTVFVDKDIHHGFTGGQKKDNTYRIKVNNYETGASFKIKAMIYGDEGDDSNGVVLIKKSKP